MGTDGENHGGDGGPSYNRDRSCSARRRRRAARQRTGGRGERDVCPRRRRQLRTPPAGRRTMTATGPGGIGAESADDAAVNELSSPPPLLQLR